MSTYDQWKLRSPDDEWIDYDPPCKWESFSGICMICGAGIDDECEWERERR